MLDSSSAPPRGTRLLLALQSFQVRGFRRLWSATLSTQIARWMQITLLSWWVLEATGSPWQVALVGFFAMVPTLFLGLLGGVLADRADRRLVLLCTQSADLVATVAMTILLLTASAEFWHAYLTILISGVGQALDNPTRRSAIHDLVGGSGVTNAIALDAAAFSASRLIGPSLAGALIALADVAGGYVAVNLLYATSVVLIFSLRLSGRSTISSGAQNIVRNLVEGFQYVRGHSTILAVALVTILMNMLVFSYLQMVPIIARDTLGAGPGLTGVLMAIDGVGGVTGAVLVAYAGNISYHGRIYMGGSMLALVALLFFSFSQWYLLSLTILVILGVGGSGFGTMQSTIVLLSARLDMRGRAQGVVSLAIGSGPIGALMIGAVATAVTPSFALGLNAVIGLIWIVLVGLLIPSLWRRPLVRASAQD